MGFFLERFRELNVISGPGVELPKDDRNRSTLVWKRPFSRLSVSANRPQNGEGRLVLVVEELSKTAVALALDHGPHAVENGKLRAEYDGRRIRIEQRGRITLVKSIDSSTW
jgi:hypothetical protein